MSSVTILTNAEQETNVLTGADLRTLRKNRSMTLAELASAIGRSVGWVSQVERGISQVSEAEVELLAKVLDAPLAMLTVAEAESEEEAGRIVRADNRRIVEHRRDGLFEELISPDLTDDFEILHSTFEAGASLAEPIQRATQEIGFIISGKLDLWFDGDVFTVGPGDSVRIRNEPYRWANPYKKPAIALWVIAPPVY
ncbi:helix-turn-helix domain-containing protein [Granulosicoccus sp. 3-233]|uniref:helix-turn-helix domain-containing protein n=1 Tax=Granulosicoccus sp. 3-233 TaxID=3417969 RepID=UPI003D3523D0